MPIRYLNARPVSSAIYFVAILVLLLNIASCGSRNSFHGKFNWRAENYFSDPQVIALCKAIEANDIEEMKKLIDAGADVNVKGKGNMTPLLWAFPDNKIERFKLLLERGADPNVFVESDFNTRNLGIQPGESVTEMAAKSAFPEHFQQVMEHGGDSNLVNPETGNPLLLRLIQSGQYSDKRSEILLDHGVDLNQRDRTGHTALMEAIGYFGQFDIAIKLLDAGADPTVYKDPENVKLTHLLAMKAKDIHRLTPQQQASYHELVKKIEDRGESFDEARADLKRWASWGGKASEERFKLMEAEKAARKAREAAAKAKP